MDFNNDSEEFENKIKREMFLNYQNYSEINLSQQPSEDSFCCRCNKPLTPLTWIEPDFYYQPCWKCMGKRKADRNMLIESNIGYIKDFYNDRILGDRYLQLFIVDDIYFDNTLPHSYSVFKKCINLLNPPSRNDIWFLDWKAGYPSIISLDNLAGLKIVNLSSIYDDIELEKDYIKVNDYKILPPEILPCDNASGHYSRYSILNKNATRISKRLKIGENCVKFYNTDNNLVKSIFKVTKNGNEVAIGSLSKQEYVVLKLALLRDKTLLRLVFDILHEATKSVRNFRDSVFLKNTVTVDPNKEVDFNFIWNHRDSSNILENSINISII